MVDARRLVAGVELIQPEESKTFKYAGNAVAAICGVLGLCLLLLFSAPNQRAMGASLISAPAPNFLNTALDFTDLSVHDQDIVRTGIITQSVTAVDVMEVLGADRAQADAALSSLEDNGFVSKKNLKSGLSVQVNLEAGPAPEAGRIVKAVTLRPELGRSVIAKRQADGSYFSAELTSRLHLSHRRIAGTISSNLGTDLQQVGADASQVSKFLSVFAYNPKIPRALRAGDRFELIYEAWEDERGQIINNGNLVFAALGAGAENREFYRYTPNDNGVTDYFDPNGDSAERFLLRKPVPGATVSSSFGRRKHPISGKYQQHKGVDLKAPMSARIYAAGDGVVEKIGRNGGFGRHVQIRHANGYKTSYAHMSGYSSQLYVGAKVKQGDLVGFVGSSGHSTGPHLHYEVTRHGMHIDPMALQLPTGRKLAANPAILRRFTSHRRHIDKIRRELGAGVEIASTVGSGPIIAARQSEAP